MALLVSYQILQGDVLERLAELPSESVHCVVTSPPYWGLRDYGCAGQIGLEATPAEFIAKLVAVFREVRRVLRKDGTCWVNMGDSYNANQGPGFDTNGKGSDASRRKTNLATQRLRWGRPKDMVGMPWRLAFALQEDGWWLRQDIIWAKPNPMPESVYDRCTKAHEYIFLLSKSARYFYNAHAIKETSCGSHARGPGTGVGFGHGYDANPKPRAVGVGPKAAMATRGTKSNESFSAAVANLVDTRNKRSVWTITTEGYSEAHFATFPTKLVEPCVLAGCPEGGTVLDPFNGSGTTGLVALRLGREYIGIELNPEYVAMTERRLRDDAPLLRQVS